jgi:formylglycine-generating enzyme required for sulfatase activity
VSPPRALAFVVLSALAVALVVARARRDSADPARCGLLVAMGARCCAPGQSVAEGRCVGAPSACPGALVATPAGCVLRAGRAFIVGGVLHAGAGDWEAQGRVVPHDATIAAFELDRGEVTEEAWGACVAAARCPSIGLTGEPGRPVTGVTREEAQGYCAFRGGRLPASDEWTWATGGARARRYAWGDTGAVCRRGAWGLADGPCGFGARGPEVSGSHPDGASPEGVLDLAGNVAEWVTGADAVRGGSWADGLATDLRSWQERAASPAARSPEVGVRCAYQAAAP